MTLDELERRARHAVATEQRDIRDIEECRRMEAVNTLAGAARDATELSAEIARAFLDALPLVRAAACLRGTVVASREFNQIAARIRMDYDALLAAIEARSVHDEVTP